MSKIQWNDELNTGIADIDRQHFKILEFTNRLDDVKTEPSKIRPILMELRTYLLFHFRFEESLLEQANYPFVKAHKRVHELIIKRLIELQNRLKAGDDIESGLESFLNNWFNYHLRNDDAAYVPTLQAYLKTTSKTKSSLEWLKKLIRNIVK